VYNIRYASLLACVVMSLQGCADILPWPAFESLPGQTSYVEQIPVSAVATQVKCELHDFVVEDASSGEPILDPDKGASVQLKLTTDLQGSVTYLGINLSKLGLSSLAEVVNVSNKVPSLQLKAQGKSTSVSQIDFVVPQTADKTKPLRLKPCSDNVGPQTLKYTWLYLRLKDALDRYKERLNEREGDAHTFYYNACQPKLTISTQFQLLFDVSAGANPLAFTPILLPISGLNIDASPDYTHYLQIAFALKETKGNVARCKTIEPPPTPPSIHS
jgi:hypothetical protein